MYPTNPTILKTALWQIPAMIGLAALIAVGFNYFRPDGIAMIGQWSAEARFSDAAGQSLVISLQEAERLFNESATLFVDARPQDQYIEGHIKGAVNIPAQDADRFFPETAERLDAAEMIIAYCDGDACDLSHDLALFLKEVGYEKVRVLVNGWSVWQQAGLPAETGAP